MLETLVLLVFSKLRTLKKKKSLFSACLLIFFIIQMQCEKSILL